MSAFAMGGAKPRCDKSDGHYAIDADGQEPAVAFRGDVTNQRKAPKLAAIGICRVQFKANAEDEIGNHNGPILIQFPLTRNRTQNYFT